MSATEDSGKRGLNLRELADLYEQTLRVRNACANRLEAVERGVDDGPVDPLVAANPLLQQFETALEAARVQMEGAIAGHVAYEWLMGIPGINRTIACRILGLIPMEQEEDFTTFSKLRVFSGLCPGRNRLVKGQKACYSTRLKTVLFVAFGSILKSGAVCRKSKDRPARFYGEIYENWRGIYKERYGEKTEGKANGWPDLRQHFAAKNKMLDVFVCHLWETWRKGMGWSVRSLYVHEKLGHHMKYNAADFSSPEMAQRKIKAHR